MDNGPHLFTKAKLYTALSDQESWTEMGVGVVFIVMRSVANEGEEGFGEGKGEGRSGDCGRLEQTVGCLEMVDIDNPQELLISTPISLEDIYVVQQETILLWSDVALGRLLSCSFNTKEGCDKIYSEILDYQRSRRPPTEVGGMNNGGDDGGGLVVTGSEAEGYIDGCGGPLALCRNWLVCRENLPIIISVMQTNPQRFGLFVRSHETYIKELVDLFEYCKGDNDQRGMNLIGTITTTLLHQPFCTDGKIISQFIDREVIDRVLQVVQFAIGRCDSQSGFVDIAQRRATFRNPLMLPESTVLKIHELHACSCLKDMLPVSLDEADANPSSLLSNYIMTNKSQLVDDICKSRHILPEAFTRAYDDVKLAFEVTAFLHDMCRTVRSAAMSIEYKSSIFGAMIRTSLIPFIRFVLSRALALYEAAPRWQPDQQCLISPNISPGMALLMACDIISNCLTFYPQGRCLLTEEGHSKPDGCLLELLLQCVVVTHCGAELQAAVDAVVSCVTCALLQSPAGVAICAAERRDIIQFWLNGDDGKRRPPLLSLTEGLVNVLGSLESVMRGFHGETRVIHILRVFTVLVDAVDEPLSRPLANLLQQSCLVQCLDNVLQSRARSVANVQSSVASFIASLLNCNKRQLVALPLLYAGGELLDTAVRRYLVCSPNSNSLFRSSLAHLIDSLCRAIRMEKGSALRQTSFCGSANNPFAPSLFASEDESTVISSANGDGADVDVDECNRNMCHNVGNRLWQAYGERMRQHCPALATRLEHSLLETPEEAASAGAETSSVASTVERNGWNGRDSDFELLLAELGVDAQPANNKLQVMDSGVVGYDDPLESHYTTSAQQAPDNSDFASNDDSCNCDSEENEGEENSSSEPPAKRSRSESSSATAVE
ncbi:Component of IIS longevity pathway SMK-1 [Trypanosoma brucei equiperdum]|uniref:Component of IIS longevity pathway SMK-1 n=1 Tax=Trypanosoma brucei equiperdum TaxID=630700 RepID=A0A3L6L9R4_9TRYP|nr:Component of IIS longevity pathway SMK-1 [Trypanosoma brucei equiperdum]